MNSFDGIAPYYGSVARLVYGDAIHHAQCFFLNKLDTNDKVLLLGGGTGDLLVDLNTLSLNLEVDYLDSSEKMTAIAKSKKQLDLKVNFHTLRFQDFKPTKKYDVVMVPFFLDCLKADELPAVISKIAQMLKPRGSLLVSDFQIHKDSLWQKMMSDAMHLFFQVFSHLESDKLQDINQAVSKGGFESIEKQTFYRNFIFSAHYKLVSTL